MAQIGLATPDESPCALVIESPGTVDMAGIAVMARALDMPAQSLAKAVFEAPTILLRDFPCGRAAEVAEHCATLGLRVRAAANDVVLAPDTARYQIAVYIEDLAHLPHAVEVVARVVGIDADQAFRLLATPPGQLLGGLSGAAVEALRTRFGPGVAVMMACEGDGVFDLHVTPEALNVAEVRRRVGTQTGLVPLGLNAEAAAALFPALPVGAARLIPRALLRFDLVLSGGRAIPDTALPLLTELFGIEAADLPILREQAPLALAERLEFATGEEMLNRAQEVGLPVTLEAAGFERCDLRVEAARDALALAETLRATGRTPPNRLPATVATDLPDLDARWLAHALERVGARVSYAERAGAG